MRFDILRSAYFSALRVAFGWKGNKDYQERKRTIEVVVENTIRQGWTPGLGPDGRPYQEFKLRELADTPRRRSARWILFVHLPPLPRGDGRGEVPFRGFMGEKKAVKLAQLGGVWGGSPIS